jgi:hypothetical protein
MQERSRLYFADAFIPTFYRWRWQSDRCVAVKVNNCDFIDKDAAEHELNVSRRIAKANASHEGFQYIGTVIDSFEIIGPHGTHMSSVRTDERTSLVI